MVLRTVIYLTLAFILVACTSGPVPIRDVIEIPESEASESSTPSVDNKTRTSHQEMPSVVKPYPAPVPLNSQLKQQAEQSLQQRRWQQAILFAERGLRINRKEPFFYWVLSAAYQQLSEIQQSVDFARQGLRYVSGDSRLKSQLMSLVDQ